MIFLIEYNRERGRLVSIKTFKDSDRESAYESRLQLELDLNLSDIENELVLLEAATEQALWQTHGRYFKDLAELATVPA
jgi:hypothetical protein